MKNLCLATKREKSISLQGDLVVDSPVIDSTHAITIDADQGKVWPWIVQIGQGRGGFYSYTTLENRLGCEMKNADQIVPAWQSLKIGDSIKLHPKFPPMLVESIEVRSHLVLVQESSFLWSWAFVLTEQAPEQTRLLIRTRIGTGRWWLKVLLYPIMTFGHYVMERRMLIGIKRRSEIGSC